MLVHAKQIIGLGGPGSSLYDELRLLDLDLVECDIEYTYDETGKVTQETIYDISTTPRTAVKTTVFFYSAGGRVTSETVAKNGLTLTKSYVYDDSTGNVIAVHVRKPS